jgi:hypothetical protein
MYTPPAKLCKPRSAFLLAPAPRASDKNETRAKEEVSLQADKADKADKKDVWRSA